jgi:hypothetical protein
VDAADPFFETSKATGPSVSTIEVVPEGVLEGAVISQVDAGACFAMKWQTNSARVKLWFGREADQFVTALMDSGATTGCMEEAIAARLEKHGAALRSPIPPLGIRLASDARASVVVNAEIIVPVRLDPERGPTVYLPFLIMPKLVEGVIVGRQTMRLLDKFPKWNELDATAELKAAWLARKAAKPLEDALRGAPVVAESREKKVKEKPLRSTTVNEMEVMPGDFFIARPELAPTSASKGGCWSDGGWETSGAQGIWSPPFVDDPEEDPDQETGSEAGSEGSGDGWLFDASRHEVLPSDEEMFDSTWGWVEKAAAVYGAGAVVRALDPEKRGRLARRVHRQMDRAVAGSCFVSDQGRRAAAAEAGSRALLGWLTGEGLMGPDTLHGVEQAVTLQSLAAEDVSGVLQDLPSGWSWGRGEEEDALIAGLTVKSEKDLARVFGEMSRRKPALIKNTEGHYLAVERLQEGDVLDTPNQKFRFVVDWDLEAKPEAARGSWDPRRVVDRLDGEQRKLYEEEFRLYREKGWWRPATSDSPAPDGEATVFPVLSEGKTTKVRPVIDLRTVNARSPRASNSRCRVNGAVTKLRGVLEQGGAVLQSDLSKAFYRIGTKKTWLIKTGGQEMESERLLFGLNFGPAALEAVLRMVKGLVAPEMRRLGVSMVELMDDYLLVGRKAAVDQVCRLLDLVLDYCGFCVPEDKREWWSAEWWSAGGKSPPWKGLLGKNLPSVSPFKLLDSSPTYHEPPVSVKPACTWIWSEGSPALNLSGTKCWSPKS